jgi:glycerol-3-phosphate dehydrogenase (NAD(P)+)
LTCSSAQSRNFWLGRMLGEGRTFDELWRAGQLAEGVFTASVLVEMARASEVETPIAAAVAAVLDGTLGIDEAIEALLTRPFRAEG